MLFTTSSFLQFENQDFFQLINIYLRFISCLYTWLPYVRTVSLNFGTILNAIFYLHFCDQGNTLTLLFKNVEGYILLLYWYYAWLRIQRILTAAQMSIVIFKKWKVLSFIFPFLSLINLNNANSTQLLK